MSASCVPVTHEHMPEQLQLLQRRHACDDRPVTVRTEILGDSAASAATTSVDAMLSTAYSVLSARSAKGLDDTSDAKDQNRNERYA